MSLLVDLARARGGSLRWHDALAALRELPALPDDHDESLGTWFAALCDRVAAVHAEGKALGDLDPHRAEFVVAENTLEDGDGGYVVSAQLVARPADSSPSLFYMSPARFDLSQSDDAAPPTPEDDVYALGVMLYEGLTLQRPFSAIGRATLRTEVRRGVPPDPRTLRRDVPAHLAIVAEHAMARRPRRRHADARELADDVRRALLGVRPRARRPSLWARGWTSLVRHPGRTFLRVLTGAVLLGSIGAAAWMFREAQSAGERVATAQSLAADQERIAEERRLMVERFQAEAESAAERWRTASEESLAAQEDQERALLAAQRAEQTAELARESRERAAWNAYVSTLSAVVTAQEAGDASAARDLLARCPAGLRGWLWDHLSWQLDPATSWSFDFSEGATWAADLGADGIAAWRVGALVVAGLEGGPVAVTLPKELGGALTAARWLPEGVGGEAELVVGDSNGSLHFVRVVDGVTERLATWTGPTSAVRSLAITAASTTGRRVMSGHTDGSLWVWSLDKGTPRHVCRPTGSSPPIERIATDSSGALLAAMTNAGVALWDAETGRAIDVFTAGPIHGAAFAPDGRRIALLVGDAIEIWDALGGDRLAACPLGAPGSALTFVDGGTRMLVGCADGAWRSVTLDPLTIEATIPGHDDEILAVRAVADGRVITVAADGVVRLGSRALSTRCPIELGGPARALDVKADRLVVTSVSGDVNLLDARTGHVIAAQSGQVAAALDNAATTLVCIDRVGLVTLWSARTGERLGEAPLAVGRVEALAVASQGFGPSSGRTLAVGAIAPDGSRSVKVLGVEPTGGVEVLGRFDVAAVPMAELDFADDGALTLRAPGAPPRRWRWTDGAVVEGSAPAADDIAQRLTRDGRRRVELVGGFVTFTDRETDTVLARWASSAPIVDVAVTDADAVVILDENGSLTMRHRYLKDVRPWCEAAAHRATMRSFVEGLAVEGLTRDEALARITDHAALDESHSAAAASLVKSTWRRTP